MAVFVRKKIRRGVGSQIGDKNNEPEGTTGSLVFCGVGSVLGGHGMVREHNGAYDF